MNSKDVTQHINNYKNSLTKMSDNRLRVEWNLVMSEPNKYSGKPLKFKLDAIRREAVARGIV